MTSQTEQSKLLPAAASDAALMEEILALVDNAPDEEVADYVKHADPDLARGFGIKPQNAPTFRERIKRRISGGEGGHRADRAICDDLDYECRERSALTRILVTSDRELGSNAAQRGAQVVRVNEFAELLGG